MSTFGGVSTFTCSFTSVCPRLQAFTNAHPHTSFPENLEKTLDLEGKNLPRAHLLSLVGKIFLTYPCDLTSK